MNWNAKSAWIYEETMPDIAKARKYGIEVIYVDLRSSNAKSVIERVQGAGLIAGAYFAPDWMPSVSANGFADWVSQQLNTLLPKKLEAPPCMLDLEVPTQFAVDVITRYRSHQPNRPTSYTNAPFQGNLVPISTIAKWGLHMYVQLYYGGMQAADASAALMEQVRRGGMLSQAIHPFYDGAAYAKDQRDGCYFTLERLP
jgi:hypothetical protein